jgi:acetyltransferase
MQTFFSPRGIVVVGASADHSKLGYGVARNLIQGGYQGSVHLVNPKGGELFGKIMIQSIAQVPEPVDLAVLIVPAGAAAQALIDCAARNIHHVIIESGGFKETGDEGARMEADCLRIAREHNIRFLGPNCIGLLDTHLPVDTTFLPPPSPAQGDLAFLSHSGAFCAAVIDWSQKQGIGFSRLVSLGNQADVSETDLLDLTAQDDHTRVICLYLEAIKNGKRFVEEASRVTQRKPIIALKVGRSASGQKAAASHTGALAGSETAYDAAFEKCGVIRANTTEEMFDWARALAWSPLPRGRRIAVLTNAGGPGVIATDAIELNHLTLATLNAETESALQKILPPAASVHNPVDMLASASPDQYAHSLKILLQDNRVDGVIVILPPPPMFTAEEMVMAMIPIIRQSDKPILIALMGSTLIEQAQAECQRAKIPAFPFPERAASAMAKMAERFEFLQNLLTTKDTKSTKEKQIKTAVFSVANLWLDADQVHQLLSAYDIPASPIKLATTRRDAATIASSLGFPVVMKIASPDILHKSDVGGIALDLKTMDAVANAFDEMIAKIKLAKPSATIDGVFLQRMIPPGQEVIAGVLRDPQFGALIMFGSGGVEVEGLKDVAFALAPLNEREADRLMDKTWAGKKLSGFRSIAPADRIAVRETMIKLSHLAVDHPEIAEMEINPLRTLSAGVVAIDVRIKIGRSANLH